MSLYAQPLLDLHDELIIDLFAGGGGASSGIEQALGRMVDVAINHDAAAVALHEANHPQTRHFVSDVFEIDPRSVTQGRRVGLLWASPDCTYHSKARGSKPIRDRLKKRRALAWVVTRWAGQVAPRVIILENVEEFAKWGPLIGKPDELRPCPKRRGHTFRKWVRSLEDLGYVVEWRELRACDYGAPTIRKRLFLIARNDGQPIVWPQPTHGKGLKPFRTAAECIDWTIPMCSIFATKEEAKAWAKSVGKKQAPIRPLAENSMRRIAKGVKRFVIDNAKPFLKVVDGGILGGFSIPRYGERQGQEPRSRSVEEPAPTIVPDGNGANIVAPLMVQSNHGEKPFESADAPLRTIMAGGQHHQVVAAHLCTNNNSRDPHYGADEPAHTIVSDGARHELIASAMVELSHGEGSGKTQRRGKGSQATDAPLDTITGSNGKAVVAANLISYHDEQGADARTNSLEEPIHTIDCANRHGLSAAFLTQNNSGFFEGDGRPVDDPLSTITSNSRGHQGVIAAHIKRDFGQSVGQKVDEPIGTITADGGGHASLIGAFLARFNGTGTGQKMDEPVGTATTKDRFGLVTVVIDKVAYFIADILMRMLTPRELYLCQGFRRGYIIDRGADGHKLTATEQVRMVGNSVSPPCAEALVAANCASMVARRAA